jgi:short-subunit dehydrogenase
MILILGKGTLATALHNRLPSSLLVGRPDFDFQNQNDCDRLVEQYMPTVVINTAALNQQHDPWSILTTNYTSPVYLTLRFYEKMLQGQIINISSASALWPSFPGINSERLCYNISKESLSMFGRHFNRKIVDDGKPIVITTVELGKFPSKFNDFQDGMSVNTAVSVIESVIATPSQQITVIK